MGETAEFAPENQGYDYAYYGLWNGGPDCWPESKSFFDDNPSPIHGPFYDFPGVEEYKVPLLLCYCMLLLLSVSLVSKEANLVLKQPCLLKGVDGHRPP